MITELTTFESRFRDRMERRIVPYRPGNAVSAKLKAISNKLYSQDDSIEYREIFTEIQLCIDDDNLFEGTDKFSTADDKTTIEEIVASENLKAKSVLNALGCLSLFGGASSLYDKSELVNFDNNPIFFEIAGILEYLNRIINFNQEKDLGEEGKILNAIKYFCSQFKVEFLEELKEIFDKAPDLREFWKENVLETRFGDVDDTTGPTNNFYFTALRGDGDLAKLLS